MIFLGRMEPVSEVMATGLTGDSIFVEAVIKGFVVAGKEANVLLTEKPLEMLLKEHAGLKTTMVKVLLITLKYKHAGVEEAAVGFYRSSLHG
jgi:hypothetical protein